jgi:hypothetical protein
MLLVNRFLPGVDPPPITAFTAVTKLLSSREEVHIIAQEPFVEK